jgi:hypothetical protein
MSPSSALRDTISMCVLVYHQQISSGVRCTSTIVACFAFAGVVDTPLPVLGSVTAALIMLMQLPTGVPMCRSYDKHMPAPTWGSDALCRVFLSETDALFWWKCFGHLGSPAQPYHRDSFLRQLNSQVDKALQDGVNVTGAYKYMTMAAGCMLQHELAADLSRCCRPR